MKVKVNRDSCIGCGACVALCDEVFEFDDEGISVAKTTEINDEELQEKVTDSAESCPTGAIETE